MWGRVRSWLHATMRRSRMEGEMDAELRFHIEAFAEDLVRNGVPREEAWRRARIEFGGLERVKEECRWLSANQEEKPVDLCVTNARGG